MSRAAALLFGAGRNTGRLLAARLAARGTTVTAMVRSEACRGALEALGARVVHGDAMSRPDVARAFADLPRGATVISTLGGGPGAGPTVDDLGNANVIDAAAEAGVARFVLVTSIGCGEMAPFRSPRAIAAFGAVVDAKTRAEEHLRRSGLTYTIVRPGGLRDGPPTGRGLLSPDPEVHGFIRRSDLAALVERVLGDPRAAGHAFAAVDADDARCIRPIDAFPLS